MSGPERRVAELLTAAGCTLATAESLTGGRLGAMIAAVPGASAYYRGGVIAYATEFKTALLGVDPALVERHGVISAECAVSMAEQVRALAGADYGVGTTGVAGPDPQEGRAPGTVFIAVSGRSGTTAVALDLVGDRAAIAERTCTEALTALVDLIDGEESGLR